MLIGLPAQVRLECLFEHIGDVRARHRDVMLEALRSDEKSRLTVKVYDLYPGYMDVGDGLYQAEEAWLARNLPPPPCHVLVGACGTGREAIALAARGYHVDAFEPAPAIAGEWTAVTRNLTGVQSGAIDIPFAAGVPTIDELLTDVPDNSDEGEDELDDLDP